MSKLLTIFIFLFTALNSSSSFANISAKELPKNYNFIQAPKFAPYFNISGEKFFRYIDISTPQESALNIEVITPKNNLVYKPTKPIIRQQIWIINNNGTKIPAKRANSFITLGPNY